MYPDDDRSPPERGLVSTISRDPPMLNWIYIDKDTYAFRYGNRSQSLPHIVGPWDWNEDETRVILDEWEGFVAVDTKEEDRNKVEGLRWQLYFDVDDDDLRKGKRVEGRRRVNCKFIRRIMSDDARKEQEDEADRKMQVKSTGGLKTTFDAR